MRPILFTAAALAALGLVTFVSLSVRPEGTACSFVTVQSATAQGLPADQVTSSDGAATAVGLEIFLACRCGMCHTVQAAGIGASADEGARGPGAADGGASTGCAEPEAAPTENDDPMDLSDVGEERTAEWLSLYLARKESVEGVKHYKAFGGTDEEVAALVGWLMELASADSVEAIPAPPDSVGAAPAPADEED